MRAHARRFGRLALGAPLVAPAALALDIALPAETAAYQPSDLPGYRLVQQNCLACHAAQYVQFQPPTSPRSYWEATVKKMKKPFGARFPDEDIPAMVDYLVRTYGAERTTSVASLPASAPKATPAAASAGPADAEALLAANNCGACHAADKRIVGPAFREVAERYAGKANALDQVAANIRAGGSGKWGAVPMPPYPDLTAAQAQALAKWVIDRPR